MPKRPNILLIGGLDPTGGAGLAVDCAVVRAHGGHPLPVATALTVQDTVRAYDHVPVDTAVFAHTLRTVVRDMPVAAVKIGMTANAALITAIADYAAMCAVPIVLDPVLMAGGGGILHTDNTAAICKSFAPLFPYVTCVTPNSDELHVIGNTHDSDAAIVALLAAGVCAVLHTQTDSTQGDTILHTITTVHGCTPMPVRRRLATFHGSGCALAAGIAALLGHGNALQESIFGAHALLERAMDNAYAAGHGQLCLAI